MKSMNEIPEALALDSNEAEFAAALGNAESMTLTFGSSPDMDSSWEEFDRCLRVHRKVQALAIRARLIIGRMLSWAAENPAFFQRKGFPNYEAFVGDYVSTISGLKRSSLYKLRFVAERLTSMTPETYEELGPTKASHLADAVSSGDSRYEEFLERAKNSSAVDFQKWSIEYTLRDAGESNAKVIMIRANDYVERLWAEFRNLPEIHSKVGSSDDHKILEAMMQECYSWLCPDGFKAKCPKCNHEFPI